MRRTARFGLLAVVATALVACGDDGTTTMDGAMDAATDAPMGGDAAMDAPMNGDAGMDAGRDAGDAAMSMDGAADAARDGAMDAGAGASEAIAALRDAPDGAVDVLVPGATVTYKRPAVGDAPTALFVQGDMDGPALAVTVDPTTLSPEPIVGDVISFRVTEMGTTNGARVATAVTDYARDASGVDVSALLQDLSSAGDVVSALDDYESEYITIAGTFAAEFSFGGTGHVVAQLETSAVSSEDLVVRMPETLHTTLTSTYGPLRGCSATVTGPMWRFNMTAQPSAYAESDITVDTCPAPVVQSAAAASATEVVVRFDRPIDPASITDPSTQFEIDMGLDVTDAAVDGDRVTLTTDAHASGTDYTVTVADTVTDMLGSGVDPAMNTAMFTGFEGGMKPTTAGALVVSEIMQNPAGSDDGKEWLEVHNPSGTDAYNLSECVLRDEDSDSHTILGSLRVEPGGELAFAESDSPGFVPDYVYSGMELANGDDEVVLECGGSVIDTVAYDDGATFPDPDGAAMNLSADSLDATSNDDGANWCEASSGTYDGTNMGTPGGANITCGT